MSEIAGPRRESPTRPEASVLAAALESAPIGGVLASTREDGRILYVNAEFTRLTGYAFSDIPTVADWLQKAYPDPEYQSMVVANWPRDTDPANMGMDVVYRVRCADGTNRLLQFRAGTLDPYMFVTAVDVTDQTRAQRALEDSEGKYSNLFHLFPLAVIVHDMDGEILDANEAAKAMFGYSMDEMLSLRIPSLHPAEALPGSRAAFAAVRATGSAQFETVFRRKDGSVFPSDVSASVFRASGKDLVQAVVTDLSERRMAESERLRLEDRLRHGQKMEAIGELAGGVAHDFNNMLTVILGNAELLNMDLDSGSESRRLVDQIVNASHRAADLTGQLLTFARRGEFKPERVEMHQVIREVESLLLHGIDRQINVVLDLSAAQSSVSGDPSSLETSVLNLGLNARDAIDGPGTITFRTADKRVSRAEALLAGNGAHEGNYLEVSVSDDGCGMDPEVAGRVFEPFFTTKGLGQGTGLGLATVYGCVTAHGGTISLETEPGKGTIFRILLPVAAKEAGLVGSPGQSAALRTGTGHILVVDDEELVRDFAATAIRSLGYTVSTAVNGEDAVRIFRTHHDDIDLVVLDLVMPKMSGQQAFREFRRIDPDVRVLISSGYSRDAAADALLKEGVAGFLNKPFRIDALAQKLTAHMPVQ